MKRNKHSLSHYKLATFSPGELVPVACFEVLPGDSIQQVSSCLLRVSPLLTPVMHPVQVRLHHWFVPHRLVWEDWEKFITGGSDGEGDGSVFPTITVNTGSGWAIGSLADYLGLPTGVDDIAVSALPFRSYQLIFNEFYRDEDLVTASVIDKTSGADTTTDQTLKTIAWEKDYFTSARPWPQKGPEVTLPLGDKADVYRKANATAFDVYQNASESKAGDTGIKSNASGVLTTDAGAGLTLDPKAQLYADLSTATAASVNTIREAFALQRYQEARARYGSRYTEYLRYVGVRSSDSRLQRPEYLGGGKQVISFSEVLQTGVNFDANSGVGTLRGHGIAAMRARRYRRFFEEHGLVITMMSVRPRTMYVNGIDRMWSRNTKEDFWQKELEHIGQQEVYNREVYAADSAPADVFGYQDRYAEYRHLQSKVSGDFRSTLNMWHLARIFAGDVTLNSSFVTCDPSTRIYASAATDSLWCMINHSIQARRMVTRNPSGKML